MNFQPADQRRGIALVHAAFVLNGIVVTMLGPLIPILTARWAISDAEAGGLFTAQFTGSMLGVGLSSLLLPRRGFRTVLVLGLLWMAFGVVALSLAGWPSGLAAVFCYGVGFGIVIPTGNLLISKIYAGGDASALNLLNMSWGIGAIFGPIAIAALVKVHQVGAFYWAIAGFLVTCSLAVAGSPIQADSYNPGRASRIQNMKQRHGKLAIIFAGLFFLYVGSENAFSGWIAAYAKRISGVDSMWALTPSFFWLTLVGGRAIAPLALRRFSDRAVASGGLILSFVGTAALLTSHHFWTSALSALIAGFGFAPVYPIIISLLSRRYGDAAQRIAGFMFALAGLGGALLPGIVGFVAGHYGSLRLGLAVPLAGSIIMLLLQLMEAKSTDSALDNRTTNQI